MITVKLTFHCYGRDECEATEELDVDLKEVYAIVGDDDGVCRGLDTDELPEDWSWQRHNPRGYAHPFCPNCTAVWDRNKMKFKESP